MADKLRLPKSRSMVYRVHLITLVVLVLVGIVAGFMLAQQPKVASLVLGSDKANCVPQSEFSFFLAKYNTLQAQYQGCVRDAWTLALECKQKLAQANITAPVSNIAKPANASK